MSQIVIDGKPRGCTPADLRRWDKAVAESEGKLKSREAAAAAELKSKPASAPRARRSSAAPPPAETDLKPDTGGE